MSCCGDCGCDCGSGCGSCGMYPDVEKDTTATLIEGVAPVNIFPEGSQKSFGDEGGHECKCGPNCRCNPCNCC